jgi:glycosidase
VLVIFIILYKVKFHINGNIAGIKLVLDFVPNHSSNLHEWFQRSVKREAPYTDYYMWADAKGFETQATPIPPNNWVGYQQSPVS